MQANWHKHLNTLIPAFLMNVLGGQLGVVLYDSELELVLMPPSPHHGGYWLNMARKT